MSKEEVTRSVLGSKITLQMGAPRAEEADLDPLQKPGPDAAVPNPPAMAPPPPAAPPAASLQPGVSSAPPLHEAGPKPAAAVGAVASTQPQKTGHESTVKSIHPAKIVGLSAAGALAAGAIGWAAIVNRAPQPTQDAQLVAPVHIKQSEAPYLPPPQEAQGVVIQGGAVPLPAGQLPIGAPDTTGSPAAPMVIQPEPTLPPPPSANPPVLSLPKPAPAPVRPQTKPPEAKPADAKNEPKKEQPSAGVLMDVDANAKAATSPPAPGHAAQPAPATAARPAPAPAQSGLVAITQDGKVAVFSNPKTRLPEQFKVGDKLANGEVVKSIDFAGGKVTTSAKEYRIE